MRANLCVRRHFAADVKPERVHPAYRRELAEGDPVCFPDGRDRAAHSAYKDNGMADQAVDFALQRLTTRL